MIENQTWVIGILKFLTKNNLLCQLSRISGLKFILHWNAQVLILAKSLFKSLADLAMFSTTKNRDASSANNSALDTKSSDKLFMSIRKNNGPNIGPCGTPASVAAQENYCPFRTTLCFR